MKFLSFIFITCSFLSCKSSENTIDKLNWEQDLEISWDAIESNDDYRVYFLSLNSDPFYREETYGKSITDFMYKDSLYELDSEDYFAFTSFVADSTNFSFGECGTFALNSGFIVTEFEKIKGYVDLGCGSVQWDFHPRNFNSKDGSISEKGFEKMSDMLDRIYLKRKN